MQHCIRRFRERFGIELHEHQYYEMVKQITSGHALFIDKQSNRVSRFWVELEGQRFAVAYDRLRSKIVTVLMPEWIEGIE